MDIRGRICSSLSVVTDGFRDISEGDKVALCEIMADYIMGSHIDCVVVDGREWVEVGELEYNVYIEVNGLVNHNALGGSVCENAVLWKDGDGNVMAKHSCDGFGYPYYVRR